MNENVDVIEQILANSNQKDVALIADGLTKQHFIELGFFNSYKKLLINAPV
jgi:hypothetical protein